MLVMDEVDEEIEAKKLKRLKRDAKRWRFTQKKGYFKCGPCNNDGNFIGYTVGIQKEGMSINNSVTGRGDTLKDAIDNAIEWKKENKL